MSKTYSDQIEKMQMLTAGVKKHMEDLKESQHITPELIKRLEEDALQAIGMNREVEELREKLKQMTARNNHLMDEMKQEVQEIKRFIKKNFEQPEWERFGLMDKR